MTKVSAGEIIKIEKLLDSNPDTKIEFKEILAYGDDKNIELGEPTVNGAKVEAELLKNGKERTVLIFKKRRLIKKLLLQDVLHFSQKV